MAFSLANLINEHIADSKRDKEYTSWRASSLGRCPRSHFYKRLGIEPTTPPDERSHRVFAVGDIFHAWIQEIADKGGYAADIETELFDEELDLGGRYDLVVLTDDNKRILFDIKTQHSRSFWHMEKSGKTISEQYPHHIMQLGAYMLMLKRQGKAVDEGRMFYVSKDDLVTKEVTIALTPELEKKVLDELSTLNSHWKDKTLPECACEGWMVGYCGFGSEEKDSKGKSTSCCDDSLAKGKHGR